jgi:hypothetical protein
LARKQAQTRLWRQACIPLKRFDSFLNRRHVPVWKSGAWECSICLRRGSALRSTDCAAARTLRKDALVGNAQVVGARGIKRRVGRFRTLSGPGPPQPFFDLTGNRLRLRRKTCLVA